MRYSIKGFTLVELLVVITIIAILVALFIVLIPTTSLKAKVLQTGQRMESVKNGLFENGQSEGSITYTLQKLTRYTPGAVPADPEPGLGGILTYGPNTGIDINGDGKADITAPTIENGAWGARGRGHLTFPWGKKFPPKDGSGGSIGPERFRLRDMSPYNTRKLLKVAGLLPQRSSEPVYTYAQYMTNRKPSEPWNDSWGHPLVVASVLYQPTWQNAAELPEGLKQGAWDATNSTTPIPPDSYRPMTEIEARIALNEHLKLYQYNRAVYISVAAVGPSSRVDDQRLKSGNVSDWANSPTAPTTGILQELWDQVNWVCQQAVNNPYDRDWTEFSFDGSSWKGIKQGFKNRSKHLIDANQTLDVTYNNKDETCLLSAPAELK